MTRAVRGEVSKSDRPGIASRLTSGDTLPRGVASRFSRATGADLSAVRVHRDEPTAVSLGATAYTIDNHVALAPGAFQPHESPGQRLLFHELAHVAQQRGGVRLVNGIDGGRDDPHERAADRVADQVMRGRPVTDLTGTAEKATLGIQRKQPTTQIETDTKTLTQADMDKMISAGYWERRTIDAFGEDAYVSDKSDSRFTSSAEERDAVFAALWQTFPQGPATPPTSKLVTIPPNAQRENALLYEFVISAPVNVGAKTRLEINFQREHVGQVLETAAEPPRGYIAGPLHFTSAKGFPGGDSPEDADRYFARHRDELRQIAYWIKNQSGEFGQLVATQSIPKGGKGSPTETLFFIDGEKEKDGEPNGLHIELRPGSRPTEVTPAAGYRDRDSGDWELEKARTRPDQNKGDMLGQVNMDDVPSDEMASVKYVIGRYFTEMGTRNAEVDAVVPIAGMNRQVFYTLRFGPNNLVDVERVGEKGSSAELDPSRMDIARVRGYDSNATDPDKLKAWLGKRYPSVERTAATVEGLRASANQSIRAQAGTPAWYQANYKITVMNGVETQTRLRTVHNLSALATPDEDNKDFTPDELRLVELSLQTLSETILKLLCYIRIGRKKYPRDEHGNIRPEAGETFPEGSGEMVVMYDKGTSENSSMFHGGPEGVNMPQVRLFTHEFGHVAEFETSGKPAFDNFVKKFAIHPFTRYAELKPGTDFFAEAFAISQTDPEWLRDNHPSVYQWFETFNRTGKPPTGTP